MRLEAGSKVALAFDGKRLVIQPLEAEIDAKSFFVAVKQSQAANGLVRLGKARGREIR